MDPVTEAMQEYSANASRYLLKEALDQLELIAQLRDEELELERVADANPMGVRL